LGGSYTAVTKTNESAGVRPLLDQPKFGDFGKFDLGGENEEVKKSAYFVPSINEFGFQTYPD
jgi:hypothetical protein